MLYPELDVQLVRSVVRPGGPLPLVTRGGRRFRTNRPHPTWNEPQGGPLVSIRGLGGSWSVASVHPSEEMALIALEEPGAGGERLYEADLIAAAAERLPLPAGASVQYVGRSGLAVLFDDALQLLDYHPGQELRPLDFLGGTYPGALVAAIDDLVVLAGLEAPWVFTRCRGGRIQVLGEIGPDTLRIFDCFVRDGRLYLCGRGQGEDEGVFTPVLDPQPETPPDEADDFEYRDAWSSVAELPGAAAAWTGTRDYHAVLAAGLASAGLCLLDPAPPAASAPGAGAGAPGTTLVLWFHDRFQNVSLLAIPDDRTDPAARAALAALDRNESTDPAAIERLAPLLEPFWPFAVGEAREPEERGAIPPVRVPGRISSLVRVRTV